MIARLQCPLCGGDATETVELRDFPYADDYVDSLTAAVPVCRCDACAHEWTDGRADEARAATVALYVRCVARMLR